MGGDLERAFDEFTRRDWREAEADAGTVRFAVIGLGWWTREHAVPALQDADNCEVTVAVSGSHEKGAAVADGVASIEAAVTYEEFQDGAAADAYDAVYVATPNALHLPHVEAAAALGKHVLCEKPMEATSERAEAMVAACDDAGVKLMIAYRMQTEPAVRRARELVRGGFVGEPTGVRGHMTQRLLDIIPDPDQWRLDPDLAGEGGSVTDLGIYPINTARFVLDADPVAVQATARTETEAFASIPDERAGFVLEFESGVHAACLASQNAHRSGAFAVTGTEGELVLEPAYFIDERRTLTVSRGETRAEVAFEAVNQMTEEFAYFADRVLADADVAPDGRHGVVDMRIIEAIYESARTDERIEL